MTDTNTILMLRRIAVLLYLSSAAFAVLAVLLAFRYGFFKRKRKIHRKHKQTKHKPKTNKPEKKREEADEDNETGVLIDETGESEKPQPEKKTDELNENNTAKQKQNEEEKQEIIPDTDKNKENHKTKKRRRFSGTDLNDDEMKRTKQEEKEMNEEKENVLSEKNQESASEISRNPYGETSLLKEKPTPSGFRIKRKTLITHSRHIDVEETP